MPEGTLTVSLNDLEQALSGVAGLLGQAEPDGGGTRLAGAASLSVSAPTGQVQNFAATFATSAGAALNFDAAALDSASALFTSLQSQPGVPTAALDGFVERLALAGDAFNGDLIGNIQSALAMIRGLSSGIPQDRTAIVSALLDQILAVIAGTQGPEAALIRSWAQSVQEMLRQVAPLIEQALATDDPGALAVEVSRRALESTLEVFGFPEIQRLLSVFDDFPLSAIPTLQLTASGTALTSVAGGYVSLQALATAPYPQFRDQSVALAEQLEDLRASLRPVLGGMRRIAGAPILQPGALEAFLRRKIDEALAVQVTEAQRIDDPFQSLFDRIDAAIDGIDLSSVRDSVLGFFEETRTAIEGVDVPSLADALGEQMETVEGVIGDLESGVSGMLDEVRSFFEEATGQVRSLAGEVGTFAADGSFQFHAEGQIRDALLTARTAIGGDPADPSAPSLRGMLEDFRETLDGFLTQLNTLLASVAEEIDAVRDAAVDGINTFRDFITDLDLPGKVEALSEQVRAILDQLGPIDFAVVVDPVVEGIDENTAKLRDIDTSSLNDLLRQALAAALDVIISIDFTVEISTPLNEQFDAAKAAAAGPVAELQRRYEEAVGRLDGLSPVQLLESLFEAFDTIDDAVGSLDLAALLGPLDAAHHEALEEPLAALKPSTLLQPIVDAQQEALDQFSAIDPAALIAPLTDQLEAFKAEVEAFDIARPVEDLRDAVARVRADIGDLRPSDLLEPLVEDFARLEEMLDQFSPSVLMAPAAELAAPLLGLLDQTNDAVITALHDLFQAPLSALDRLNPDALASELQGNIDEVIALVRGLNLPSRFNQLKGAHFDLKASVQAGGSEAHLGLTLMLDPQRQLGELVDAHNQLLATLEQLRDALVMPDLAPLFDEVRERMLAMLPPYARALLDRETFQRLMRLADPTRFLAELDTRFQALKDKLIPIRPADIAAELDASYDALLALVDGLEIDEALGRISDTLNRIKGVVSGVRVDFVADDIQRALDDLRSVLGALDVSRLFPELDAIHAEVQAVVAETRPSVLLAGLGAPLTTVQGIVASVNPRTLLGTPLNDAWSAVVDALAGVDFAVLLQPLIDKLDELEVAFRAALQRVENSFDAMLSAGKGALAGGGGAAVGAGVSL